MTRNTNNSNAQHDELFASLEAELRAVHESLDRDAAARRGEPDDQFEQRVAVRSFGGLMASASEGSPVVAGRIGSGYVAAKRLAAAIAILATAGAAWLAMRPSGVTTAVDPIVAATPSDGGRSTNGSSIASADAADDWISIATTMDDGTGAEIDALFADTIRVESNLKNSEALLGGSVSMDGGGV